MLFNEPKLLKFCRKSYDREGVMLVSVLFNEPKLLKCYWLYAGVWHFSVSVLFNEPKLLK